MIFLCLYVYLSGVFFLFGGMYIDRQRFVVGFGLAISDEKTNEEDEGRKKICFKKRQNV